MKSGPTAIPNFLRFCLVDDAIPRIAYMMEEVWGCCSWTALPEWHYYSFSVLSVLFFVSLFFGAKKGTALIFGVAVPAALVCGYFQFHFHSWMRTPKEEADWQHKADVILSYGIFVISLVPAIALLCFALISLACAVLGNSVGAVVGKGCIALAILLGGALFWQGVLPIPPFPFPHQFVASYLLILTYAFLLGHLYGVLADFHTVSKCKPLPHCVRMCLIPFPEYNSDSARGLKDLVEEVANFFVGSAGQTEQPQGLQRCNESDQHSYFLYHSACCCRSSHVVTLATLFMQSYSVSTVWIASPLI